MRQNVDIRNVYLEYYTNYIHYLTKNPCNILFLEADSYVLLCNIAKKLNIPFSSITKKFIVFNPIEDPRTYINRIHRDQLPNYVYHYGHNKYIRIGKSDLFVADPTYKPDILVETMTTPSSLRKTLYKSITEWPIPILSSHHLLEQLPQTVDRLLSHHLHPMSSSLLTLPNNQAIEYIYEKPKNRNWLTCLYVHGFKSSGTSGTKASQTKYAMTDNGVAFLWRNFRGNNVDHDDTLRYEQMDFQTMADDTIAMIEYAIKQWATEKSIIMIPSSLWATATIQALMKRPDLQNYIKHIYFLAPCINFGEYKTEQAIKTWDLTPQELDQRQEKKRKEEIHFKKTLLSASDENLFKTDSISNKQWLILYTIDEFLQRFFMETKMIKSIQKTVAHWQEPNMNIEKYHEQIINFLHITMIFWWR